MVSNASAAFGDIAGAARHYTEKTHDTTTVKDRHTRRTYRLYVTTYIGQHAFRTLGTTGLGSIKVIGYGEKIRAQKLRELSADIKRYPMGRRRRRRRRRLP